MSKTIIQCYFPIPDFQGFGCYLSANITLHSFCKKNNYILKHTYYYHDGLNSLLYSDDSITEATNIPINKIPVIHTFEELINFIEKHNNLTTYFVSFYGGSTDVLLYPIKYTDSINFVKNNCLHFKDELVNKINNTLSIADCIKSNYISVHLRIGDEELVSKKGVYKPLYDCLINNFKNIILPLLENDKIIIVSDSITFKKILKLNFFHKNLYIVNTIPSHTGITSHISKDSMLDTLHDFGIMAYSKKIYMISAQHQHPFVASFFSRYCACIYDIPIVVKKIQLEIFSNKSSYLIK